MNTHFSQTVGCNWKKLLSAAVLGAFALAPVFAGSTPARADDDRYDRNHHNRDDYRNDDYRSNDYRDARTLEGVVSNDQPGNEFVLQLDNGQRVQVRSEEREPRRLSAGDRVRVQGYYNRTGERDRNNTRYNDNVIFHATDVQVIRNGNGIHYGNGGILGGYGNSNRRSMSGVVTDIRSDHRVTVRIDGRDYDVQSAWKLNDDINRGTRVQVVNGEMRGNNIVNAIVVADKDFNGSTYDNGRYNDNRSNGRRYNGSYNSTIDFTGTVIDTRNRDHDRILNVRGDNGRTYSLRVDNQDQLRGVHHGDRVRVFGYQRNGVTTVTDLKKF